jgi:hypothetical protein
MVSRRVFAFHRPETLDRLLKEPLLNETLFTSLAGPLFLSGYQSRS